MSDAVVNPLTVLVHFEYVVSTFFTVMRPFWLPCLSTINIATLNLCIFTPEWCFHALWNATRISKCGTQKTQVCHWNGTVECDAVEESSKCEWNSLDKLLLYAACPMPEENVDSICHVCSIANQAYSDDEKGNTIPVLGHAHASWFKFTNIFNL